MKLCLKVFLLFSLLNSLPIAAAETLKVSNTSFNFTLKQDKNKFELKQGGATYSFDIKKCNQTLFEKFWDQIKYKKNDAFSRTKNKSSIRVQLNSENFNIAKNSQFGRYLASLPDNVRGLRLAERRRCEK